MICLLLASWCSAWLSPLLRLSLSLWVCGFSALIRALLSLIICIIVFGIWLSLGSQLDLGLNGVISVFSDPSKKAASLSFLWNSCASPLRVSFCFLRVFTVGMNDRPLSSKLIWLRVGVKFWASSMIFLFPSLFVLGFVGLFSLNGVASGPTSCQLFSPSSGCCPLWCGNPPLEVWECVACFWGCDC